MLDPDSKSSTPVLDEPPTPPKIPPRLRPAARPVALRRHPAPPPLWRHLVLLCLKPEHWAQSARYPLLSTLLTLGAAILLVALITGAAAGRQAVTLAHEFAQNYDQHHPALLYKDGTLSLAPPLPLTPEQPAASQPAATAQALALAAPKRLPQFLWREMTIAIDPSDKTTVDSFSTPQALIVGSSTISLKLGGPAETFRRPLTWFVQRFAPLLPAAPSFRIDGPSLQRLVADKQILLAIWLGFSTTLSRVLADSLWALATAFLVHALVMLGAPSLMLPRRIAYRIAFAVMVPLIVLGGAMELGGVAPVAILGPDYSLVVWFFAAAALAFWAGLLANRRFAPRPKR